MKPKKDQIYSCHYTDEALKIDGHFDEKAWKKAKILDFFVPVTNKPVISKTEGRVLWNNKYLYVGFKAYDKDIWGYFTKRDSKTYQEDVLEVFIKPDLKKPEYYNFEINARGAVYDAFGGHPCAGGGDQHRWARWNCAGLKVGIKIKGTLNDWTDQDEYWQMEVGIPFASLPTLKGRPPKTGDVWQFHLSRYDYSVYLKDGVELSSCARLKHADFHKADEWILMKFEK